MNRRALLALGLLFVALRLLLVLSAADRIHPPDWAEAKHSFVGDRWIEEGAPPLSEVLTAAREPRNAAHGGFLLLSGLYAVLSVPLGASDNQLALKLCAIAFACLGFLSWTAVATRLGGRRAGWAAALLLLIPPPIYLASTLVTWGSHAEAGSLLGLATLLLLRATDSTPDKEQAWPLALGWTAATSLLLAPLCSLLLLAGIRNGAQTSGNDRGRRAAVLIGRFLVLPLFIGSLTLGPLTSVTEEQGNEPIALLSTMGEDLQLVPASLNEIFPLPLMGPLSAQFNVQQRKAFDLLLTLLLLTSLAALMRHKPELGQHPERAQQAAPGQLTRSLLLWAPLLHLLLLVMLGPRRPSIELRYLAPIYPLFLVTIAVSFASYTNTAKGLADKLLATLTSCTLLLWCIPGVSIQTTLLDPTRIGSPGQGGSGFFAWHSPRYIDHDIGNVGYETATGVNDFLAQRSPRLEGFALVPRLSAGQDLLRAIDAPVLHPDQLLDRILRAQSKHPKAGPEREHIYENLGWAMAIFTANRPGLWRALLSHLGNDRAATARGLGIGLVRNSSAACQQINRLDLTDRQAAWTAAAANHSDFADSCTAPD